MSLKWKIWGLASKALQHGCPKMWGTKKEATFRRGLYARSLSPHCGLHVDIPFPASREVCSAYSISTLGRLHPSSRASYTLSKTIFHEWPRRDALRCSQSCLADCGRSRSWTVAGRNRAAGMVLHESQTTNYLLDLLFLAGYPPHGRWLSSGTSQLKPH